MKLKGWKCPVCGVGVAPYMPVCPECAKRAEEKKEAPVLHQHAALDAQIMDEWFNGPAKDVK